MTEKPVANENDAMPVDWEPRIYDGALWIYFNGGARLNLGDKEEGLSKFADLMAREDFGE